MMVWYRTENEDKTIFSRLKVCIKLTTTMHSVEHT